MNFKLKSANNYDKGRKAADQNYFKTFLVFSYSWQNDPFPELQNQNISSQ